MKLDRRSVASIITWYNRCWLVVDANFEASGAPVNKLYCMHGTDLSYGCIHIPRDDISSVQKTACHILSSTGVAFHHLVGRIKNSGGYLAGVQLLVVGFLCWYDWSKACQRKVDSWVWNQVSLEFIEIDVQLTFGRKKEESLVKNNKQQNKT